MAIDPKRAKIAGDCYRRGTDALNARNFKLAMEMYTTCVRMDPSNLMYRQILRGAERKSYDDNGTGAGGLAKMKIKSARSAAAKAIKKEQWDDADMAAEEGLRLNPWDVELNTLLARAAMAQENTEIAELAMGTAVTGDPDNDDLLEEFAGILAERGKYDAASRIWSKICQLRPNDGDARAMVSRMAVLKTQHDGGYEEDGNAQDAKLRAEKFYDRTNQSQKGEQDEEGKLGRLIRQNPKEIPNYLKLSDLLAREKRFQEAYDTLKAGLEVQPNNTGLLEEQQKMELELRREKIKQLLDGADTEEGKEKLKSARRHLLKREIEIFSEWAKRNPKDMDIKFELATRLMSVKQYQAAIPLLQKATQSPKHKAKAYVGLGRAFISDKKLGLARGQFERAIPDLNVEHDQETYIEAHYLLGRVCEELGDTEVAEKAYGEVLVLDYDYRDALARLEGLQQGASS